MKAIVTESLLVGFILIVFLSCTAQTKNKDMEKINRHPAVAGSFYPANRNELTKILQTFFDEAPDLLTSQPLAVIVPHAGYVFSGEVAAAGFKQIDREKKFEHIFIMGSSHTSYFNGASIYTQGDFITPLGNVPVDTLASILVNQYKVFTNDAGPHQKEHSIEVELPFLQYWLKNSFSIIPIIIGGQSQETSKQIAKALSPYMNPNNLFVISTDFSHYPTYSDAVTSDKSMADAVCSNSVSTFLNAKRTNESSNTPNLLTAMCGWTSVLTLLYITENRRDLRFEKIEYRNSGDVPRGDTSRVVGYNAIGLVQSPVQKDENTFELTDADKINLLKLARTTITNYIQKGQSPDGVEIPLSDNLKVKAGAFVTLKENGTLRGCIGNFQPDIPLYKVVQRMAIAASSQDYRFSKVTAGEINQLEIEISVLTLLHRIQSIDELVLGKHGIYIKKGGHSGTFLPQVATETGWNKEQFLGHCAQDKAGIGWNGWKDAELYVYEALVFSEDEFKDQLK